MPNPAPPNGGILEIWRIEGDDINWYGCDPKNFFDG